MDIDIDNIEPMDTSDLGGINTQSKEIIDEEVEDINEMENWNRPPVPIIAQNTDSIAFQWIDIDICIEESLETNKILTKNELLNPILPVIRIYGVNENGNSIFANVYGFVQYFYVPAPHNFGIHDCENLRLELDKELRENSRGIEARLNIHCLGVVIESKKASILGYQHGEDKKYLRIFLALPDMLNRAKNILDNGIAIRNFGIIRCPVSFESNVPFVLRFMVDKSINGSNWLEIQSNTYQIKNASSRVSRCQIEINILQEHVISHPCEGIWSKLAPLRILSFDIECMGRKGIFPEADQDPVIQIASCVSVEGKEGNLVKNVFTLGGCGRIIGAHVIECEDEAELLMGWSSFLKAVDPDIITGYNIQNFDVPYLINRAKTLNKKDRSLNRFADWGRLKGILSNMKETTFQSSAYGKRENIDTSIPGRVMFDMLPYFFRNHKLSSYTLNNVSAEFLGQQKDDIHYSIISDLQRGTNDDRRRLALYCIKDAQLPLLLMKKLAVLINYIEMARVTGVPLDYLLTRGQQIKVFSMLLRKCRSVDLIIPNISKHGNSQETYEGATVIDPKKAFYKDPIATLDFASLYPSIMQAYNLCYSTLVPKDEVKKMNAEEYQVSPSGDIFVKSHVRKGILPMILEELLTARKKAKNDMAKATDPMMKAVQNGRQLALKISANSVYGFTGATVGQLPCLPIASSVTAYGRELLLMTKEYVEATYNIENGFEFNADIIYGDTDSVMIKFGTKTVAETMPLAKSAAEEISKIFPHPIKLEFEKVYSPYLLMNKKRYAGLLWTNAESFDKMDTKGLETVRRDNCMLVRKVIENCLYKILIERDVEGAILHCKEVISQLLQDKIDLSLLVITKALAKSADMEGYAAKQAHVELAMRMKKRDPGTAPNVGDRVPYVIIQKGKKTPAYERSEDPVYVLENNLPIDTNYYLTNQLAKPILRLFEPIITNPQSLLQGDHTRTVVRKTPSARPGGIMMFAVKKASCMICKTSIEENGPVLCSYCLPRLPEIYLEKITELQQQEIMFSRFWTHCQNCQGNRYEEVICSNNDCPIFYKRKKVEIDLEAAQKEIDKFSW